MENQPPNRIQAELAPQLALEASWAKRLAAQAVVTLMCRGGEMPWDTNIWWFHIMI